jgi:hypothetical protein
VTDQNLIDHRVPFVIKPPGRNGPVTYAPAINTLLTHDLILAILRGEVADQSALAGWLDANGKPLPTVGAAPE